MATRKVKYMGSGCTLLREVEGRSVAAQLAHGTVIDLADEEIAALNEQHPGQFVAEAAQKSPGADTSTAPDPKRGAQTSR